MRKLNLFLVLALLLVAGPALAVQQTLPQAGDVLGQNKYQSDPHRIFRMVRYVPTTYNGATTLAADSIVVWDTSNDDGVTVTTTTTSSDSAVAGIIVVQALTPETDGNTAAQDAGKKNWTWLQTYGKAQVNFVATVGAVDNAGAAFGTSTTAGEAAQFVGSTTDPRAQGKAGFVYDTATAGDDDVEVFLLGLD